MIKLTLLNIGLFQGIVIGSILLHSPFFKSKTNQYLAFAIFTLSLSLLNLVLDITQTFESYQFLKVVDIIDSALLFPIFILLFVIHQINHPQKNAKKLYWLFTLYLFSIIHGVLDEAALDTESFSNLKVISVFLEIFVLLIHLFFIPFLLVKTYQIVQHSKHKQEKRWLTYLWSFEVGIFGSWLLTIILSLFTEWEISDTMHILALLVTVLIHWVAYVGVYKLKLTNDQEKIRALLFYRKPKTESASVILDSTPLPEKTEVTKGQTVPSKENIYYQKLERLCSDQKIYRDSSLDRNTVAEMLGISPSYVSQIVNSITGDNFATYINRYRVEDAKTFILDKEFDNYSLLSIGLECGFSSKTTYYNSFKKMTGMTPNAYRKNNQ